MHTKKFFLALIGLALLLTPSIATAGLIGTTVQATWYVPDMSSLYCTSGTAVVGAGVEWPNGCSGFAQVRLDVSDTQIVVALPSAGSFGAATFNGFLLSTITGPDIVSATYGGGTLGVTSLLVSGGDLWVNLSGQAVGAVGGSATINFTTAGATTPVLEPASMLLLGTGLAGAGLRRWRQKRA